jgi:hypothetical protein
MPLGSPVPVPSQSPSIQQQQQQQLAHKQAVQMRKSSNDGAGGNGVVVSERPRKERVDKSSIAKPAPPKRTRCAVNF